MLPLFVRLLVSLFLLRTLQPFPKLIELFFLSEKKKNFFELFLAFLRQKETWVGPSFGTLSWSFQNFFPLPLSPLLPFWSDSRHCPKLTGLALRKEKEREIVEILAFPEV